MGVYGHLYHKQWKSAWESVGDVPCAPTDKRMTLEISTSLIQS